ncbi:hypothetical protein NL676_034245 [Syzygium grande]|nr:hypothetical protein NL676_034245 [Syzygium grande]
MPTTAAGTSSDATALGAGYQVFLSFRGPDTRHGFADTLYHALVGAGVRVFRDDEELRVGEKIGGALLRAIDDSKLYIPIFSRSYAASKWEEILDVISSKERKGKVQGLDLDGRHPQILLTNEEFERCMEPNQDGMQIESSISSRLS